MADDRPLPGAAPSVPPLDGPPAQVPKDAIAGGGPGSIAPPPLPPGAITAEPMALPPIPLDPTVKPAGAAATPAKDAEHKDTFRELVETIVFVVVLVLMLKTFLAEAFVIPTGSMAVTLLGYHHKVACKQCGKPCLANASDEADPQRGEPQPVVSFDCENCGYPNQLIQIQRPAPREGGQP